LPEGSTLTRSRVTHREAGATDHILGENEEAVAGGLQINAPNNASDGLELVVGGPVMI
jgi:hypothetical protein